MRICLLTTQDLDAGRLPADDWPCDPRPFLPEAEWRLEVMEKLTCVQKVITLAREGFDVFFNLCDGAWDEGSPGIEVIQTLEGLEQAFTGATSEFYEPTREAMKRACRAWGIDTPAYVVASTDEDLERAADTLRFPLFVKHHSSYASVGLTRASRVRTPAGLFKQGRAMMKRFGAALVEEFVEGTECTVLVAENPADPLQPTTYVPMQYQFPKGESFKHSKMKWVDYNAMSCVPVDDPGLDARLREASARFFLSLNGAGYGRCDIRVDADGRPFMLEINANCGLYYLPEDAGGADLCLGQDPAGHEGFTRQIVEAAIRRTERNRRPWEVRPRPDGGYGVHARKAIEPGDRIIALEGQAHELVSRSHVEAHWQEPHLTRFREHAWPLTDEVWVTWSRDPMGWRPIRHSCDPTAWLEGLDVVARRALAPGDEITMDHATFRTEPMPSFECACGADLCRGLIRAEDHLQPFVERYAGHVSDHVRRERARRLNG